MSATITPSAHTQAMIASWKQAKDTERQWTEYRHALEAAILEAHKDEIGRLTAWLSDKDTLTMSVEFGDLQIKLGSRLELDEAQVVLFLSEHPELASVLFKCKHEPQNSRAFLKLLHGTNELSEGIKQTAKLKPIKPGFTAK
jgi:hypothetical protein